MIKNNKGFSLIELMVVVAIVGILAAIAIPNFATFQNKARSAEAKVMLGAVFTCEKAFQMEWGEFNTGLLNIGWRPEGNPYYNVGFSSSVNTTAAALAAGAPAANANCYMATGTACTGFTGSPWKIEADAAAAPAVAAIVSGATNNAFVAYAQANLKKTGAIAGADIWSINTTRVLANVQPGY